MIFSGIMNLRSSCFVPFSYLGAAILSLVLSSEHITVCGLYYRTAAAAVLLE